jgi:lipoprotein-anchoring transpeptidase ErfK/SrfK
LLLISTMFDFRTQFVWALLGAVFSLSTLRAEPIDAPAAKILAPSPDAPERVELCRVQIFLDRAGFRPGKIDGLGGEFTQKAADRYCDSIGVPRGTVLDISSVPVSYREHVISEDDARWVGPTAATPAQQAKLKTLKYGSLWEAIAERFHCDQKFLVELNPQVAAPVIGSVLRVPDVPEFLLSDVKALEKERAAKGKNAVLPAALPPPAPPLPVPASYDLSRPIQPSFIDQTPPPTPTPTPQATPVATPEPKRSLVLLRAERLIELYEDGRIIGCFPCTPGSAKIPVPLGTWKIISNLLLPHFRWDKSVLESGVRSENAFMLPPGPNSPVGIVWMGINRPSIGIHGTNTPDRIGRNESSGCIRLANWDAFTLCQLVKAGTPVEVR